MTNHLVRVHGDRANSLTYGMWSLIRRGGKAIPMCKSLTKA